MEDLFDFLLFGKELAPDERASVREKLDEEPDLAEAWAQWHQVRTRLRRRLQNRVSDRRLLVLYALDQDGHTEVLTNPERRTLEAARDEIEEAIETIPGLKHVVDRIQEERADFETMWEEQVAGTIEAEEVLHTDRGSEEGVTGRSPKRTDRAQRPSRARRQGGVKRWTRRLVGAALLVAVGVLALLFWPDDASVRTVEVEAGEVQMVEFDDGSTVRLVGAAALEYPTDDASSPRQQVTLTRGQAFFNVQDRDEASFVVKTPTATATVLGTQFGVTTRGDTTEVVLASGRVRVEAPKSSETVVLEPGQRSRVSQGQAPQAPEAVDLTEALEWTGLFVFRSVSMSTIAERLRRHYAVNLSVDPSLADESVTGTFERDQPVEQILKTLATTLGGTVEQDGEQTYRLADGE